MSLDPVSVDIMTHLAANGLGTIGTDLFAMEWGQDIDAQALVTDTDGVETDLKGQYEQPTFQILVRGDKQADGRKVYAKARAIYEHLIQQTDNVEIGTVCYKGFEPLSTLAGLGRDENARMVYTMNFYTYRGPL